MARPIWTGTLSFGLLNIPISLMSGEKRTDLHFRMLDARNNAAVRYERVNAETGEEVPWKEIVKAYEYDKGNYVVLEPDDIKSAAAEGREAVEIEAFVDAASINPQYFEKPYVLVPGKKAEKGYVLLRETLKRTGKIGISRVVVRTREYLSAVMPQGDALILLLMRYPQELVDVTDYKIPEGKPSDYRVTPKELQMAEQLIDSMSGEWKPEDYKDEFRARLHKVIEKRLKQKGVVTPEEDEREEVEESTNVVDFMSLLQKSLATNKRTPAKKSAASGTAAKKKSATKKTAKKAPPAKSAKKATKKAAVRKAG
jgi:DNA end-binding protein Ku